MTLLLVRHAQALSRSNWDGDDSLRPLSTRGRKQAGALVASLTEWKPTLIISSPYLRCVDTVMPLATALGLIGQPSHALVEGSDLAAVQLVSSLIDEDAVLCSHGDVIPIVLHALDEQFRLGLGREPRNEKASVWVLETRKGKVTKATYRRPPR